MKDSLGDRMKSYEAVYNHTLTPNSCVFIRVDGRAFHTFTKNLEKPFDPKFMASMEHSALQVAKEMQGFKLAYVQSDEATFMLTDFDTPQSQPWFANELNKMVSITASLMSVHFNDVFRSDKLAVFDARAFVVPLDDAPNVFVWRQKDWLRNSLQMYCQSVFTHKEMQGKKTSDLHDMLYAKGLSWSSLPGMVKNGTFINYEYESRPWTYDYSEIQEYIKRAVDAKR